MLTKENSAYQFSSTIDLPQRKGGHVWGRLTFQRGDASTFEVDLPTTTLGESFERVCAVERLLNKFGRKSQIYLKASSNV